MESTGKAGRIQCTEVWLRSTVALPALPVRCMHAVSEPRPAECGVSDGVGRGADVGGDDREAAGGRGGARPAAAAAARPDDGQGQGADDDLLCRGRGPAGAPAAARGARAQSAHPPPHREPQRAPLAPARCHGRGLWGLSLIHISEPTRPRLI
eukprot:3666457-Rhodomonas_salina.1